MSCNVWEAEERCMCVVCARRARGGGAAPRHRAWMRFGYWVGFVMKCVGFCIEIMGNPRILHGILHISHKIPHTDPIHITQYLLFPMIIGSIYAHAAQWVFSTARRAPRGRCSENACSHTW